MHTARPLPSVIGRTENALRPLLTKTLSTTPITSYSGWVVLNAVATSAATQEVPWRTAVADALNVEHDVIDAVLAELRSANLIDEHAAMTRFGRAELTATRAAVAATTARLVEDLGEEEQETTRRVLDHIRIRAEALLRTSMP